MKTKDKSRKRRYFDISEVITKSAKLEPIIVTFEHASLNYEEAANLQAAVFSRKNKGDRREKDRIVAVKTDKMTYLGKNYGPKAARLGDLCRTFVAIRNKLTNKVRLVEVSNYQLSPHVKEPQSTNPLLLEMEDNQGKRISQMFKSKSWQQGFEKKNKYTLSDSTLTQQKLKAAADKVEVKEEDLSFNLEINVVDTLRPPCHPDAEDVKDVYKVNEILPEYEMTELKKMAAEYLVAFEEEIQEWRSKSFYSEYFLQTLEKLQSEGGDTEEEKAALLIYAECIIFLQNKKATEINKNNVFPDVFPTVLTKNILEKFTEISSSKRRTRSHVMKDKAFCHLIVLALLIGQFEVDLTLLRESLHMSIKKCKQLCQVVGATFITRGLSTYACLKLPLAAYSVINKTPSRRGRRRW